MKNVNHPEELTKESNVNLTKTELKITLSTMTQMVDYIKTRDLDINDYRSNLSNVRNSLLYYTNDKQIPEVGLKELQEFFKNSENLGIDVDFMNNKKFEIEFYPNGILKKSSWATNSMWKPSNNFVTSFLNQCILYMDSDFNLRTFNAYLTKENDPITEDQLLDIILPLVEEVERLKKEIEELKSDSKIKYTPIIPAMESRSTKLQSIRMNLKNKLGDFELGENEYEQ